MTPLHEQIEAILAHPEQTSESLMCIEEFLDALEKGRITPSLCPKAQWLYRVPA